MLGVFMHKNKSNKSEKSKTEKGPLNSIIRSLKKKSQAPIVTTKEKESFTSNHNLGESAAVDLESSQVGERTSAHIHVHISYEELKNDVPNELSKKEVSFKQAPNLVNDKLSKTNSKKLNMVLPTIHPAYEALLYSELPSWNDEAEFFLHDGARENDKLLAKKTENEIKSFDLELNLVYESKASLKNNGPKVPLQKNESSCVSFDSKEPEIIPKKNRSSYRLSFDFNELKVPVGKKQSSHQCEEKEPSYQGIPSGRKQTFFSFRRSKTTSRDHGSQKHGVVEPTVKNMNHYM
jgi:hypothetical protein